VPSPTCLSRSWFAPRLSPRPSPPADRLPAGRESKDLSSQGRKVDPSAVPPTFGNAALWPTGRALAWLFGRARLPPIGAALYRWRSAPEPTGEPWKLAVWSGGSRVHSLSSPLQLAPTAGSLCRRREVLVPITARIRMWRGVYGERRRGVKWVARAVAERDAEGRLGVARGPDAEGRGRQRAPPEIAGRRARASARRVPPRGHAMETAQHAWGWCCGPPGPVSRRAYTESKARRPVKGGCVAGFG
jgi:hypothetical protein